MPVGGLGSTQFMLLWGGVRQPPGQAGLSPDLETPLVKAKLVEANIQILPRLLGSSPRDGPKPGQAGPEGGQKAVSSR
jgi:hypothetical protein